MQVINRRSIHDFRVMILIVLRPESDHGPGHPFPLSTESGEAEVSSPSSARRGSCGRGGRKQNRKNTGEIKGKRPNDLFVCYVGSVCLGSIWCFLKIENIPTQHQGDPFSGAACSRSGWLTYIIQKWVDHPPVAPNWSSWNLDLVHDQTRVQPQIGPLDLCSWSNEIPPGCLFGIVLFL